MSIFSKDVDEMYDEYLEKEGSMFGKMDKQEFERKVERAEEIASGFASGLFERDEEVWEHVRRIKDC
jgi:hypothetical protein